MQLLIEAFAWTLYALAYRIGSIIIFVCTFGLRRAEPLRKRDPGNINSFDLEPNQVSQEAAFSVGYLGALAIFFGTLYVASS